jgi:hypothetical protein
MIDDIYIEDDELRQKIAKKHIEIFHNSDDLVRLAKISFVYFLFIFLLVLFWNRRNIKYRFKI